MLTDGQKKRAEKMASSVMGSALIDMDDADQYDAYLAVVIRRLELARKLNQQLKRRA